MESAEGTDQRWLLTVRHSPIGMALVGLDGRLLAGNDALAGLIGRDPDTLPGLHFQDFTHPKDRESGAEQFARVVAGEIDALRIRKRYLRTDGEIVWVDVTSAPVRSEDGTPLHLVAQVLDVTEEHGYEQRLAAVQGDLDRERRTLEAIFDTVDVGLLLIDTAGNYQRMNPRHAETMRLPFPHGHRGQAGQLGEVYHPDGRTRFTREEMPSIRAARGEEYDDLRYWVGRDPHSRSAFSVSARTVRDENGEMTGAALAYKEITDLMRALQVKEDFVASVSHELRTPLTSVLGRLELLLERDDLPADVPRQMEIVERSARRLLRLVSDLLNVAQIGDGGLQLEPEEVDLVSLLDDVAEATRPQAEAAGLTISVTSPDTLTTTVDAGRIRQVVDNLVSNAVKYSDPGGKVVVALSREDQTVCLSVTDTGHGLDEHELAQVFNRFFRGDRAVRRHIPGTGLGLHIVRSIVEAHGGRVAIDSDVGVGTTVSVSLPSGRWSGERAGR